MVVAAGAAVGADVEVDWDEGSRSTCLASARVVDGGIWVWVSVGGAEAGFGA